MDAVLLLMVWESSMHPSSRSAEGGAVTEKSRVLVLVLLLMLMADAPLILTDEENSAYPVLR